jgi:hypothetical protein
VWARSIFGPSVYYNFESQLPAPRNTKRKRKNWFGISISSFGEEMKYGSLDIKHHRKKLKKYQCGELYEKYHR